MRDSYWIHMARYFIRGREGRRWSREGGGGEGQWEDSICGSVLDFVFHYAFNVLCDAYWRSVCGRVGVGGGGVEGGRGTQSITLQLCTV